MTEWRLVGWGATGWDELRRACRGMTVAWLDYDGFQVGDLPEMSPPSSHLWAWGDRSDRVMRARADGDEWIVGWLVPGAAHDPRSVLGEPVEVVQREIILWAAEDGRVTRPAGCDGLSFVALEVQTAHPISFIRATSR